MSLPLDVALAATGATLVDALDAPATVRVSTDTRSLEPGDTFLALRGENFDGHAFAAEAVSRGAAMLILDETSSGVPGTPAMMVRDTLKAYLALGAAARRRFPGMVVGITGSAGKTTTKFLLAQLLAARYGDRVLVPPANENNEIGVSKLMLALSGEKHDVAVVEMGARRPGDIATLVACTQPQLGVLTNIGEAHLEIMGSRATLEETKWALFGEGADAILNADDTASIARAPSLGRPPHWFLARPAEPVQLPANHVTALFGSATLVCGNGEYVSEHRVDVRMPGQHNRSNMAAALAAALELGVPVDAMLPLIPKLRLPRGRYESIELPGSMRIIYDAYNANATGMIAALDAFARERAPRRIAVLSSMAELGDESEGLHERVGAHAAARVDVLLVGGEFAEALARGAERGGLAGDRIVRVTTNGEAARWLREHAGRDDVVLLKGSRRYKLEEIVEELRR